MKDLEGKLNGANLALEEKVASLERASSSVLLLQGELKETQGIAAGFRIGCHLQTTARCP